MGSMTKDKLAEQVRKLKMEKNPKGARRISDDIRKNSKMSGGMAMGGGKKNYKMSGMMKAKTGKLVGKQKNLPKHLQEKILA